MKYIHDKARNKYRRDWIIIILLYSNIALMILAAYCAFGWWTK